jgi:hypothetical protein
MMSFGIPIFVGWLAVATQSVRATYLPERSETGDKSFVPFQEFLKQAKSASYSQYMDANVSSQADFTDMQKHISRMYDGVTATKVTSFLLGNEYGDCIYIKEQPSFRHLKLSGISDPPSNLTLFPKSKGSISGNSSYADSPLKLGLRDPFGNPISCPSSTIPMARLTLEKLTRFKTLSDFFAKAPRGVEKPQEVKGPDFKPDWEPTHLHAYAEQNVANFGGNSWLDLWNPKGDFSLSQQWYVGGSGCDTQTVEGGWLVYPDGPHDDATLFIYWTKHYYNIGSCDTKKNVGCYNLDCDGFVQINHNWFLGGPWDHYSTTDGQQWGFEMQWKLYAGNWWLFLKGPGSYEAVGYYPTSIYDGGQMSKQAELIQYGGEVTRKVGDVWPQMGSGDFAEKGWQRAAYQNTIFWIPRDENGGYGEWARLASHDEGLPSCFTIDLVNYPNGGDWGTYFYFGGPGGNTCN